ncbi:MAG: HD family phosphohydrolase [Planctomycetaceae bacterium]
MSGLGFKRGRQAGRPATGRLSPEWTAEWRERLLDPRILRRVGATAVAIGLIIIGLQAWQRAFPYRLGDRPSGGVAASVTFNRVNRERTTSLRDRAADRAPLVFRLDDKEHAALPAKLRTDLQALASPARLADLPDDLRRKFGLSSPPPPGMVTKPAEGDREAAFERLKGVVSDETALQELLDEFKQFLQKIEKTGLIRPENLPADLGLGLEAQVEDSQGSVEVVELSSLQLTSALAVDGPLNAGRWALFPALTPHQFEFEAWLRNQNPETLKYESESTSRLRNQARSETPDDYDFYAVGQQLVKPGEPLNEDRLDLLRTEHAVIEGQVTRRERFARVLVVGLMLGMLALLIAYHLVRNEPKLLWNFPQFCRYLGLIVAGCWLGRWLSFDPWRAETGAVLAIVMICAVVYNQVLAILTSFALSVLVSMACGGDLAEFAVLMCVCATGVILLPNVPTRSTLVKVGLLTAAVCFLMTWGTALVGHLGPSQLLPDVSQWQRSLRAAGWCVAAGFLVSGSLPFIESWFGAVTDISLLELGDISHPLLQELVKRAPGTYNHSITVASLGETAADSIGANGLLVRVGAYFHDVGKMLKPHYFIENSVNGENRHENLAPAMSTLIIIGHVKDGAELARQHGLPQSLIDFIEQHHGTTLVEYFYREATRHAGEQPDHRHDVEESAFRYPGPKPQTREAAVLMITDAVEGATRALTEPTPSRIERLVHDIILKRLLDGQFSESGITLTDLDRVEDSLTRSLTAMYHGRIKYPENKSA